MLLNIFKKVTYIYIYITGMRASPSCVRCGTSCTSWDVRQAPGRPSRPGTMYYPSGKQKKRWKITTFSWENPLLMAIFMGKSPFSVNQ